MMKAGWAGMPTTEVSLAERRYKEHVAPSDIAERLGHSESTIARHAIKKMPRLAQVQPSALTGAQFDYFVAPSTR